MARSNTGSVANVMTNASAVFTAAPATIAAWFNVTSAATQMNMVYVGNSAATNYFGLFLSTTGLAGKVVATCSSGGDLAAPSTASFTANVWHHGAAVFTSTTSRQGVLNGVLGTANTTSQTPVGGDRTELGVYTNDPGNTGFNPLNGSMAEVGIWDVALTADELISLSKGVSPLLIRPADLLAYWPLIGRSSPEPDRVGTFPMTVTGTMPQAAHTRVFMPAPPQYQRFVVPWPPVDSVPDPATLRVIQGGLSW